MVVSPYDLSIQFSHLLNTFLEKFVPISLFVLALSPVTYLSLFPFIFFLPVSQVVCVTLLHPGLFCLLTPTGTLLISVKREESESNN